MSDVRDKLERLVERDRDHDCDGFGAQRVRRLAHRVPRCAAGARGCRRQVVELVPQLDDDALGGFLANARQGNQ